ncbi:MAG: hypothetical protein A2126_00390 [Candidatus Woykebacteria bacterium GWB1_45_5]|nr:MAG: hypothetical protein A2126_00390 [Candidatus Woykebacteria bacterium GWB1_45_5]
MKIAKLPTAKRESVKCFKKSLLFGILFRVGLVIIILFFGWTIWQYKPLWNFVKSLAPDPPLHGIGISSGCANPTRGGQPLVCFVSLQNTGVTDTAHDTLMVRSLVQVIHAASGDISSGNIIPLVTAPIIFTGGA